MDFLKASVAQVTAYFMERWGKAGGYTQISDHDLSEFAITASASGTPHWQRTIIEIALRELGGTEPARRRLHNAIMIAVCRSVNIPLSVQQANPASTDSTFKNLENRYHAVKRSLEYFPELDPYKPHDLRMMCDVITLGRFDIAAQIFVSAENKTKREWMRRLRLD